MPTEVVDLLAGLSVERAVALSLLVCGASAVPLLLLVDVEHLVPQRVRDAHLAKRAASFARPVFDAGRDLLVTVLLAIVRHIEPKGTGR